MKIIIGVLILALALLGLCYIDLHLEQGSLEALHKKQLAQQAHLHKQQLREQLREQQQQFLKKIEKLEQFIVANHNPTKSPASKKPSPSAKKTIDGSTSLQSFAEIRDESLTRAVDKKYAILFPGISLNHHDQEKLRQLLVDRERVLGTSTIGYYSTQEEIANSIRQQQELLTEIDGRIAQLLGPEDTVQYELLKDSSYEQHQMNNFYEKLGNKNTLSSDSQRALLLAKLEQKKTFNAIMQEATAYMDNASAEERQRAAKKMHAALLEYKESYLREARHLLNDEQFALLSEYEQMQYEEMWSSLEAGWRAQSN